MHFLLTLLMTLLVAVGCTKDGERPPAPKVATGETVVDITSMVEFHYRYIPTIESLILALGDTLSPAARMVWARARELTRLDLWVFPAEHIPGTAYKARVAGCAWGEGRALLSLLFRDKAGRQLTVTRGAYMTWSNPEIEGGQKYTLLDDGKRFCIASSRGLLDRAMTWRAYRPKRKERAMTLVVNAPLLFASKGFKIASKTYVERLTARAGDQKQALMAFFTSLQRVKLLNVGINISSEARLTVDLPLMLEEGTSLPQLLRGPPSVHPLPAKSALRVTLPLSRSSVAGIPVSGLKGLGGAASSSLAMLQYASAMIFQADINPGNGKIVPAATFTTQTPSELATAMATLWAGLGEKLGGVFSHKDDGNRRTYVWQLSSEKIPRPHPLFRYVGSDGIISAESHPGELRLNQGVRSVTAPRFVGLDFRPFSLALLLENAHKGTAESLERLLKAAQSPEEAGSFTLYAPAPAILMGQLTIPLGNWLTHLRRTPSLVK